MATKTPMTISTLLKILDNGFNTESIVLTTMAVAIHRVKGNYVTSHKINTRSCFLYCMPNKHLFPEVKSKVMKKMHF